MNRLSSGRAAMTDSNTAQLIANEMRTILIDALRAARSGHPGTPLALAPLEHTPRSRVRRFDPRIGAWRNRDRSVTRLGERDALRDGR